MIYPVYVTKEPGTCYGVIIPDFPGCFSAADSQADLPANIQEAIEVHMEGEDLTIPEPSSIDDLQHLDDYTDGHWLLVDIDISKINTKAQRVNISLAASFLSGMDKYAKSNSMTRSALIHKAVSQYMAQ